MISRKFTWLQVCVWLFVCIAWIQPAGAAERRVKRVLIIGIDGCRTDALKAANAPNLHRLMREGAVAENTSVLGERNTGANTLSGPGWSALLTGVWADKHGVKDNEFKGANFGEYPHFFTRLKQVRPEAVTISVSSWPLIHERIVSDANTSLSLVERENYPVADARVATEAAKLLKDQNPDAMVLYFGNVDATGHNAGYGPEVKEYMQAVEQVDSHIGTVMKALRARANYAREDWLVLVASDHGGRGKGHKDGHQFPEVNTVFMIASGPSAVRGHIKGATQLVDVPATALTHLGVALDPAWKLDGHAVGLKGLPR